MARKVRIEIELDAKGGVKSVRALNRAVTKLDVSAKKTSKGVRKLDGAVTKLDVSVKKTRASFSGFKKFLGVAFLAGTIRQMGRFAKRMFELGAATEETRNKFREIFRGTSAEVDAFGDSFANMAGLTQREFQDFAANIGTIMQGVGIDLETVAKQSTRVIQLAADLASFNNTSMEDAFNAIQSGLVGQVKPLRRYGILLDAQSVKLRAFADTGKTVEKELTNQDKVLARLSLAYERAGVAVGDLERTQTSAANEARKFNAIIREQEELLAEALLPALNEVRGAFSEAVVENKNFVRAGIILIGIWASEVVRNTEEAIQAIVRWTKALGLIKTRTTELAFEQRLLNMILSSHVPAVEAAAAADAAAARIAAETAKRIAAAAAALKAQNKGLTGITDTLNEEIRKLAFQVRDLTQADVAETRALMAKVSELREELRLRRQLLGLAGAPVEGLQEAPELPPPAFGVEPPSAERFQLLGDVTDAIREQTFALQDQEAAEAALHQTAIARAVALGAAQANVLEGILASVRQIIQARLAEAIAGAVASSSILGPIAGAAAGALMAVLFNQLMPSGHKSSSGGAGAQAADTTSTLGVGLGGIRVQNRGFTTGATGAAPGARAPLDVRVEVVEKDLFTINVLLKNADGVRAQVGSI